MRSPSASRARMSPGAAFRLFSFPKFNWGTFFVGSPVRHSPTFATIKHSSRSATIRVELTLRRFVELQLWIKKAQVSGSSYPLLPSTVTTHKSVSSAGWAVLISHADSLGLWRAGGGDRGILGPLVKLACRKRQSQRAKRKMYRGNPCVK